MFSIEKTYKSDISVTCVPFKVLNISRNRHHGFKPQTLSQLCSKLITYLTFRLEAFKFTFSMNQILYMLGPKK